MDELFVENFGNYTNIIEMKNITKTFNAKLRKGLFKTEKI